jgi:hypothetical protein
MLFADFFNASVRLNISASPGNKENIFWIPVFFFFFCNLVHLQVDMNLANIALVSQNNFFTIHNYYYPANGMVDFEEWSAYKIQLHGIEWIVSLSGDWDQSLSKKNIISFLK